MIIVTSCAWRDNRCRIGLILGTGTNACYLEDIKNIETINPEDFPGQEHMVINTEWGAFGDNGELDFVKTKWDLAVDETSVNPGKQLFEKMISGRWTFWGHFAYFGLFFGDNFGVFFVFFNFRNVHGGAGEAGSGRPHEG